jgi:hypothetical protein
MIPATAKCKITSVPDNGGIFSNLLGANATATSTEGARGTGTQAFKLDAGGMIFGNSDSGFKVEIC